MLDSRFILWLRTTGLDLAILVALFFCSYGLRISDLSIRGEESRRATVAMEMTWTGDWIVPRQQGQPFLSRPPMENWLIGLSAYLRGDFSPSTVRIPSLLSVLFAALLIYGYCRSFLGRVAAVGAAAGYASMPEILQMGRLAESDAIFAFFLGGAFLVWHWGWSRHWPAFVTWGFAYLLAACATLTKGPQAPAYFGATIVVYLLSTGQWRRLFSPAHLAGLLVYAFVVGIWLVPYWIEMGSADTWKIFTCDSRDRFVGLKWQDIVRHLIQYPAELAGCTAPWSFLLCAFASRRFRATIGDLNPHVRYLAIAILVSFPTCWITPGGQTRYMMPLYPCIAVLAGIAIDRLAAASPRLQSALAGGRALYVLTVLAIAVALASLTWIVRDPDIAAWRQPPLFAAVFCAAALLASIAIWQAKPLTPSRTRVVGLLAICSFTSLSYSGAVVNQLCARSEHASDAVAALKQRLPTDAGLVSLGPVHHKFAYEFGRPIKLLREDERLAEGVPPGGWFCYLTFEGARRDLPFASTQIAAISMDRNHSDQPQVEVIVAQRAREAKKPETTVTQR